MALIVVFENMTNLSPVSDYRVRVFVNEKLIDGPIIVKGHKRVEGYKALVEKFVRLPDAKTMPTKE